MLHTPEPDRVQEFYPELLHEGKNKQLANKFMVTTTKTLIILFNLLNQKSEMGIMKWKIKKDDKNKTC